MVLHHHLLSCPPLPFSPPTLLLLPDAGSTFLAVPPRKSQPRCPADDEPSIHRPEIPSIEGLGMILQEKDQALRQDVTAMPSGHLAAQTVEPICGRDHSFIDENLLVSTANSVAIHAHNALQKRHIGRQISAFPDEVPDPFGHVNEDKIAPLDGPIIDPVESDGGASGGVVDQFFWQVDDRCDGQGEHREDSRYEQNPPQDSAPFVTRCAARWAACCAFE